MLHDVRHRWLRRESCLEPPGALSRVDAEGWLPRLRLSRRETRLRLDDQLRHLHPDERRRPMSAVFQVPDHRPSHLRSLSGVWRGHRHRCEPEGSEHFRNEVDQNYLKADSGGRNRFGPKNSTEGLSPSPIATERQTEPTDPNAGLNSFDPKMIHLKKIHPKIGKNWSPNRCLHHVTASRRRSDGQSSRSSIDSMAGPNRDQPNRSPIRIRPWIRLWKCPLPDLASPKDVRRLEGRLTCPSATNWKKKDWPCDQPTGPRPLP